jgi:hypothetical protein
VVPVPARKSDPNYKRLSDKQKAYNKVYNGKACLQCPDEYATLKNKQQPLSAAKCRPCPPGQLPDFLHVFCGEQNRLVLWGSTARAASGFPFIRLVGSRWLHRLS